MTDKTREKRAEHVGCTAGSFRQSGKHFVWEKMEKETAFSQPLVVTEQSDQTNETQSNLFRSQNCARELMFGRGPLSILKTMKDEQPGLPVHHVTVESKLKGRHTGHESCKRKLNNVEGNDVSINKEETRKVIKIVDNAIQKDKSDSTNSHKNTETCGKLVQLDGQPPLSTPQNKPCIEDRQNRENVCAVNFPSTSLQADWSLPCFRTVENQVSDVGFIGDRVSVKQVKDSTRQTVVRCEKSCSESLKYTGSGTLNQRTNDCTESESHSTYSCERPLHSDWNTNLCEESISSFAKTGCQQSSSIITIGSQQQMFQSMQLEDNRGEAIVMSTPENNHGQLILLPETPHQPQLKMDFQSLQVNNQRRLFLPKSISNHGVDNGVTFQQNESSGLQLNSSGEEIEQSNDTTGSMSPQRTPYPSLLQKQVERAKQTLQIQSPLYGTQDDADPSREQHNHKERIRRARIRDACHLMRQLVPGMSDKTDKATVFEFAARYVHFLRTFIGEQYDKEFLIKYSPY